MKWPDIRFQDEVAGNQFKAVIPRPVTPEVARLVTVLQGEMSRGQIMVLLGLKGEKHFRVQYQQAGIASGLIEMTLPDKPRRRLQRYRLTAKGQRWLAWHGHST